MQKTDNQIAVAFAAIGLCATFILAFCLWWFLDAACDNAHRRMVMKAAGGVGCFEFWFNRYQSLIGNALTAGVAGVTLLWIARQLVPANQQASIAAAAALRTVVDEWSKHGRDLIEIKNKLDVRQSQFADRRVGDWADVARQSEIYMRAIVEFRDANATFKVIATQNRAPAIQEAAEQAEEHYRRFREAANKLATLNSAIEYVSDREERLDEAFLLMLECEGQQQAFLDAVMKARRRLVHEIEKAWKRIRELEHSAIGPWWREK